MDGDDVVIPEAYVTKWALTRGIVVWKNAIRCRDGYVYPDARYMEQVGAKHWTESKPIAETRWRDTVKKEAARLKAAAAKYEALAKGAPVYAKEEG